MRYNEDALRFPRTSSKKTSMDAGECGRELKIIAYVNAFPCSAYRIVASKTHFTGTKGIIRECNCRVARRFGTIIYDDKSSE
jgi:hypothetical protein